MGRIYHKWRLFDILIYIMSSASIYIDKAKGIWAHAGFQKYFQNTSWMFFGKIASMAISFIATAYIARSLGPTSYGELSYAISFVSLFSFIAVLGIDQILYRDLIKYPEKRDLYMGSAFILRISAAILAIILCLCFAFLLSPRDVSIYLIFILCIGFLFNSFQIINYEFQADSKSKFPSILSIYIAITLNILKIFIIIFNQGVIYLAGTLLLESILYTIGFLYYRKKIYGSIKKWKFDKKISLEILMSSWPLIFSSAFALIYARIDQIMIKNLMDAEAVGLYDAAVRLSEVWYFIPTIIISSILPAVINARKTLEEKYYSRLKKIILFLAISSFSTSLITFLFAPIIIKIIFGPNFIETVPILKVYVWSNVATALNALTINYLILEDRKKTLFISSFTGMAVNVILNIILIPRYGTIGAALATVISYFSLFIFIFTVPNSKKIFK